MSHIKNRLCKKEETSTSCSTRKKRRPRKENPATRVVNSHRINSVENLLHLEDALDLDSIEEEVYVPTILKRRRLLKRKKRADPPIICATVEIEEVAIEKNGSSGDEETYLKARTLSPGELQKAIFGEMVCHVDHTYARLYDEPHPDDLEGTTVPVERSDASTQTQSEVQSVAVMTDISYFRRSSKSVGVRMRTPYKSRGCGTDDLRNSVMNALADPRSKRAMEDMDAGPIIGNNVSFGTGPLMPPPVAEKNGTCLDIPDFRGEDASQWNADDVVISAEYVLPSLPSSREVFFKDLVICNQYDENGNWPLHIAVLNENVNIVKRQCIALGLRNISVDNVNHEGLTPLQLIVSLNSTSPASYEIISTLLKNGASLDVEDVDGSTVIHSTVLHSNDNVLEILLNSEQITQFNINSYNLEGVTPLMLCSIHQKIMMADMLLRIGADPNARDRKSGRTAIFFAVENNDVQMAALLKDYGADTKIRNFAGTSARDAIYELDSSKEMKSVVLHWDTLLEKPIVYKSSNKTDHHTNLEPFHSIGRRRFV